MKRVCIMEEHDVCETFQDKVLIDEGYEVFRADAFGEYNPDIRANLIIYNTPGGAHVENRLKLLAKTKIPIMIVSEVSDTDTKIRCLRAGANDYIVWPYVTRELVARIEVQLRAHGIGDVLRADVIEMDCMHHRAVVNGNELSLTRSEFMILKLLMLSVNRVVTRAEISSYMWGYSETCDDNSIHVHISNLRGKLKKNGCCAIETVWGVGFQLKG